MSTLETYIYSNLTNMCVQSEAVIILMYCKSKHSHFDLVSEPVDGNQNLKISFTVKSNNAHIKLMKIISINNCYVADHFVLYLNLDNPSPNKRIQCWRLKNQLSKPVLL